MGYPPPLFDQNPFRARIAFVLMATLINRFAATLSQADARTAEDVRAFVAWQEERLGHEFVPQDNDDVDVRTYLLDLQTAGASRTSIRRTISSLKRFYAWAKTESLLSYTPFDDFNFDRPLLTREQIRRRQVELAPDPQAREIARLRALNRLADHLNRSADLQAALGGTLETLVEVMGLRTAWAFLWTAGGGWSHIAAGSPHDFALTAHCGLPPGLNVENFRYLRRTPDCHCQVLMRAGRLIRAVNVVECTRCQNALEAAGDIQGLVFHATVPLISQGRALGIINIASEAWEFLSAADLQFLSAVGAQVAIAVERARLYEVTETQRARLERELEMARQVQASLLPRELPAIPGFSLASDWRSAREVAGDFYDVFPLPEGRWGLVVGDVSDKGAPAALYMAMVRSLIRSQSARAPSPAAALTQVNYDLLTHASGDMFVTVFYAVLDPAAGSLTWTIAGHDPPLVRRASGSVERLPIGGQFLGAFEGISLPDGTLRLEAGEALLVYTDGLTDAQNDQGQEYGRNRLATALASVHSGAATLQAHLLADLAAFTGGAPQPDDITLLILMRERIP